MASIQFTDTDGTWKLHNGKPFPASRFAGWTPDSAPFGDSAARLSDGALTTFRIRDDFGVTFELPAISSQRSWNGFTFSEEFDNAAWSKTRSSISANATTAPDGSLTADKLVEDATATNSHEMGRTFAGATDNTVSTWGIYGKALSNREVIALEFITKANVSKAAWFNLSTGVIGTTSSGVTARVEQSGAWRRCIISVDLASGGTTPRANLYLAIADGSVIYSGDGVSGVHLWGAQLAIDKSKLPPYLYTGSAAVSGVSLVDIADRLKRHLLNGGQCIVNTNDAAASIYATCGLKPGTVPQLTMSDRRAIEFTLSLQLLNLAGSPVRMSAYYVDQ